MQNVVSQAKIALLSEEGRTTTAKLLLNLTYYSTIDCMAMRFFLLISRLLEFD